MAELEELEQEDLDEHLLDVQTTDLPDVPQQKLPTVQGKSVILCNRPRSFVWVFFTPSQRLSAPVKSVKIHYSSLMVHLLSLRYYEISTKLEEK